MKRTFKYLKCHPKYKKNKSCISTKVMRSMRDKWNSKHPDKQIKTKTKKIIETQLRSYLSECNHQKCLIDKTIEKQLNIFAPKSPSSWNTNKSEWLNNFDISRVMTQYEEAYPKFKFLGPSPIDFDTIIDGKCVWTELCNLSIKEQFNKNKNKIGIIFNLDTHDKGGSHWVSLFIDLENKYILYLDSNGITTPKEIDIFINRIVKQCQEMNMTMKIYKNKKKHQYKDGECGMYSLYTIIKLLENKHSVNYFMNTRITDEKMNVYRRIFYNSVEL
jgi:hypothetical protein